MFQRFTRISRCAITATLAMSLAWSAANADEPIKFEIPAQAAAKGLNQYAEQANLQIMFPYADVKGVETNEVVGELDKDLALETLLADTGLEVVYGNNNTATVRPIDVASQGAQEPGKSQPTSSQVLMAQNQTSAQQTQTSTANTVSSGSDDETPLAIEEIIVTGSHIRGLQTTVSPVYIFDRGDIDASGYATLHQFVQTIPQNFGGGPNENSANGSTPLTNTSAAPGAATGINLRGLGTSSTLTLLNGRRIAPSGQGSVVDLASIPVAAVERIEVLADGASAVYGSDAIAGVVNIILRDDYEGAETRLSYLPDIGNDYDQVNISQTFGKSFSTGNLLFVYEYFNRSSLDSSDRSFAINADRPLTLLPDVERNNLFAVGNLDLSDSARLSSEIFYNERKVGTAVNRGGVPSVSDDKVTDYGAAIGAELNLSDQWAARFYGAHSRNEFDGNQTRLDDGLVDNSEFDYKMSLIDAVIDGPLVGGPGGDVLLAIGAHYRSEDLSDFVATGSFPRTAPGADREVSALFAEISLPLVGPDNSSKGIKEFDLSLALRHEDYSDFGTTTDPKFGLHWQVTDGLGVRGTWGTSFRAPQLTQMSGESTAILFPIADPVLLPGGGTVPVLILTGADENLGPEEATTWTIGLDMAPTFVPGLDIQLTYFDIDYTDRIQTAFGGAIFGALAPEFLPIVPRDPDTSEVQALIDDATTVFNFFGFVASDVRAIVDERIQNISIVGVRGLDFLLEYSQSVGNGDLILGLSGSYYLDWERQVAASLPATDELNTVFDPVDMRLRASALWSTGSISTAIFANYTGSSLNDQVQPDASIDSWTTVDVSLQYDMGLSRDSGFFDDVTISLNVVNLFDEAPPFVEVPISFVNYDGTNANALGQAISVQFAKKW